MVAGDTPTPTDTQRIDALFHRAVRLPPNDREEFLAGECGTEPRVLAELRELLAADAATTQGVFRSPLQSWAALPPRLGHYTVGSEIGDGGMGRVFRARQEEPIRREVAIKVLKAGLATAEGRARFSAERQALARMRHPGIAAVLDGGTTPDGRPYLVMELVEGQPLHRWLATRPADLTTRLTLFLAVCRAVQHAHQKGIIHRDLKPSNILVEDTPQGAEPRVIDFGVARMTSDEVMDTLHTAQGAVLGTPGYISPEQMEGTGDADVRSDVYALGVILYELLTGARPYAASGTHAPAALIDAVRTGPPAPPSRVAPEPLSSDLDWIALRALEAEPDRRYPTAEALHADIQRFLRNEPVAARPPSRTYLVRKFVRRHRTAVLAGALGLSALVAGMLVALDQWRRARSSEAVAQRNLGDFRRLVDDKRLQDLEQVARHDLWPAWPATVAAMDRWILRAQRLVDRGPELRQRAEQIEQELGSRVDAPRREELDYQRLVIQRLVAGIDELAADAPTTTNLAGVRARREQSLRTGRRSETDCREAWASATAAIADTAQSPIYGGLALRSQMGLVPLGQNPETRLWEFWHEASGARPRPDPRSAGRWIMGPDTGMVFVLIPAGRFVIGAVPDPEGAGEAPIDPRAARMEQFVRPVELSAFFLSRFEMTQGQWLRTSGENPSYIQAANEARGHVPDLSHPVEQVNWLQATEALRRMGLVLPTEAQWEYACRAGTKTAFANGVDPVVLCGTAANLADEASRAFLTANITFDPGTDDGYALTAPVGRFAPNRWGLHDVHGNVGEWCRDWLVSYLEPAREGDGLRPFVPGTTSRCWRGGDFADPSLLARSAARNGYPEDLRTARVGLRPARAIQ